LESELKTGPFSRGFYETLREVFVMYQSIYLKDEKIANE
jgi:hypothetical protein